MKWLHVFEIQAWKGYWKEKERCNKTKAPISNFPLSFQPTAEQKAEEVAAAKPAEKKEDAVDGKAEKEEAKEAAAEEGKGEAAPAAEAGGDAAPAEPAEEKSS